MGGEGWQRYGRSASEIRSYPITEWESPEHRLSIPLNVQQAWNVSDTILRFPKMKRDRILSSHPQDALVIRNIDHFIKQAYLAGPDIREGRNELLALIHHDGRVYRLVAGRDNNGSLNLITVFGTSRVREYRRWESWLEGE